MRCNCSGARWAGLAPLGALQPQKSVPFPWLFSSAFSCAGTFLPCSSQLQNDSQPFGLRKTPAIPFPCRKHLSRCAADRAEPRARICAPAQLQIRCPEPVRVSGGSAVISVYIIKANIPPSLSPFGGNITENRSRRAPEHVAFAGAVLSPRPQPAPARCSQGAGEIPRSSPRSRRGGGKGARQQVEMARQ